MTLQPGQTQPGGATPRTPPGACRPLVWIVDDSPTEALIAERSLGAGYDFERFVDGSVVVERLAAGAPQPDLVLLDWVMPGMAGDEVCRFLRTDSRTLELPIILITASRTETSDVANGLASGANDYVARPFAAEELRARVDSAIRVKRLSERIAQFQQEMLGIVGHDLRGPLGAILIGTEMLAADGQCDPANVYVVKRIESCARRMTRMVDQLLDMTRARLGNGIAVARQRTPLVLLVRSVVDELSLAHRGTPFELVAAAEVVGWWDPDRLGQVVSNLLGNAVQYGLAGAPITVGVTGSEAAATLTVHNQLAGAPIPAGALATLFEPYRRGGDHEQNRTGLGLGLYIVHEIVRAHGGTIDVASSPSGTTFRVVLPRPVA